MNLFITHLGLLRMLARVKVPQRQASGDCVVHSLARLAKRVTLAAAVGSTVVLGACSTQQGPYAPLAEGTRSPLKAEKLTQEAATD